MSQPRITRREAVQAGSALAAGLCAPYVLTSTALGSDGRPAASDRITVGHVGVGGRGRALFAETRQVPQAQSVAVADCYQDRRQAIAAVCQGQAYADFRQLLDRSDVDAVIIATPDHWHVPICQMAAASGKHVYVEKPLGLSIHQDLACLRTFQQSGLVFQYGTQQRSMPHCHRACELVRRGAIGEIRAIEVDAPNGGRGGSTDEAAVPAGFDYEMWLGPAPQTPYTPDRCQPPGTYWVYDQSIGYLAGWGAHPLDLMVWACDADLSGPVTVSGSGDVPTSGLYDTVLNWEMNILLGQVRLTFRPGADRTRFIGSEGWIQVARDPQRTIASDPHLLDARLSGDPPQLTVSQHHMGNFIEAVAAHAPRATVTSVADSVRSDVISHLCDIAVRCRETITWDPARHHLTAGSAAARAMLDRPLREPWTL
jgi:predicted dehydrogenase